jgi:YjbE family integral membrane protein
VLDWLRILGSIILIDLVLSGDNALVIGAVAASLQSKFRWIAFLVGGGGAILVRILLTYSFTILLQVHYLETIGGVLLLFIAARLLLQPPQEHNSTEASHGRMHDNALMRFLKRHHILMSILTILVADLTTSLDNIVAIAALARSNTILLIAGLLLSITLLLVGSAIIANLIQRLPWLILVAAGTLAIVAAQLVIQDTNVLDYLLNQNVVGPVTYLVVIVIMLMPCVIWVRNYNSSS